MAGEMALLDPAVRRDAARVLALLHPDFVEFGSSGRIWHRSGVVAAISADPGTGPADVSDVVTIRLGPDAVLVTYRLETDRRTLRSSVWVREAGTWLLRFHQGTSVS